MKRIFLASCALLSLAGCAAQCVQPGATQMSSTSSLPPACQLAVDGLQAQDTYLKTLTESAAPLPEKQANARIVQSNLRIGLSQIPAAACPPNVSAGLTTEVNQRIGQIDSFVATGIWEGPVATR